MWLVIVIGVVAIIVIGVVVSGRKRKEEEQRMADLENRAANGDISAMLDLSKHHFEKKKYDVAEKTLSNVLNIDPNNNSAKEVLGKIARIKANIKTNELIKGRWELRDYRISATMYPDLSLKPEGEFYFGNWQLTKGSGYTIGSGSTSGTFEFDDHSYKISFHFDGITTTADVKIKGGMMQWTFPVQEPLILTRVSLD